MDTGHWLRNNIGIVGKNTGYSDDIYPLETPAVDISEDKDRLK
jgi:hypothetical protein